MLQIKLKSSAIVIELFHKQIEYLSKVFSIVA